MKSSQSKNKPHSPRWLPGNRPRDMAIDATIVLITITLVLIGFLMQRNDPTFNWLMRFSAVASALCVILEYRQASFASKANTISIEWASGIGGPHIFEISLARKIIAYLAHVGIVVCTALAGFGDLLFAGPQT